jgi:molybdate transport system substrate-binding protein
MRRLTVCALLVVVEAICGRPVSIAQENRSVELNVFAAASLTEAFNELAEQYRALESDVKITFNFAGSQQLAQQISQGAPLDIFVSANMKQMIEAARSGRIDTAAVMIFAHNRLVVVYPKENAAGVHALRDLRKDHLKIILADKAVPVGQYSLDVLEKCGKSKEFDSTFRMDVLRNVVSYEENVKVVLSKIVLGEADAGIVYTSDVSEEALHDVGTIEIPDELNIIASYPIAVLRDSKELAHAKKFVAYVLSEKGEAVMARFGFIPVRSINSGK